METSEAGTTDRVVTGVTPKLTSSFDRDPFVGTPWHKFVPARLSAVT